VPQGLGGVQNRRQVLRLSNIAGEKYIEYALLYGHFRGRNQISFIENLFCPAGKISNLLGV